MPVIANPTHIDGGICCSFILFFKKESQWPIFHPKLQAGCAETKPDRLDKCTKAYCWEYIRRTRSIGLFRNPSKSGNPVKASEKESPNFDVEPEALETLRSKGFEVREDIDVRFLAYILILMPQINVLYESISMIFYASRSLGNKPVKKE